MALCVVYKSCATELSLAPSPSRHFDCWFCLSVVNHTTESLKNKGRKVARVEVGKSFVYRTGPGPTGLLWLSFPLSVLSGVSHGTGTGLNKVGPRSQAPAVSCSADVCGTDQCHRSRVIMATEEKIPWSVLRSQRDTVLSVQPVQLALVGWKRGLYKHHEMWIVCLML